MHRWKILFALACAAALVACGNDPPKTTPTTDTATTDTAADTAADTAPADTTTDALADATAETAEDVAPGTDAVAETAEDVAPGTDAVAETVEDVAPGTDAAVDTAPVGKTHTVVTSGFAFDPPELTIAVGDSVEFKPGATHTATQVDKATWDADGATPLVGGFNIVNPATGTVKFDQAGDIYYVCVPHSSGGMKGKIIVQ